MLQLSQRARLRPQSGFICTSCRHVLSQQQQLTTTSSTSHSPAYPSNASLSTGLTTSRARIPSYPHNFRTFHRRRPFSTTSRKRQSQENNDDKPNVSTVEETYEGSSEEAGAAVDGSDPSAASPPGTLVGSESIVNKKNNNDTQPGGADQQQSESATALPKDSSPIGKTLKKEEKTDTNNLLLGILQKQYAAPAPSKDFTKKKGKEVSKAEKEANLEDKIQKGSSLQKLPSTKPATKVEQKGKQGAIRQTTPPNTPKKRGRLSNNERMFGKIKPQVVNASSLKLVPVKLGKKQPPVARLAYGLDRVLFNPGVYQLQDPRTRVYNFDPYLARIMPIKEFDWTAIKQFVTSSKDTRLIDLAAKKKKKYTGSTSSMTAVLSHFHFLLSAWRPVDTHALSRHFDVPKRSFTPATTAPAASFLHYKDGVYAIDADKEFDNATILSQLGHSLEKLLTVPKEEFEKYRRVNSGQLTDEERQAGDTYHYSAMDDFMLRSQLDATDPRLPGTGTFDLKTRAVVSIRYSSEDMAKNLGYEIRNRFGQWESYEREYFDLIRSAFLKYSLQVRIGNMDGCFVAYHNTERIFGFQYISLSEMDAAIHGTPNTHLGDNEFRLSLHLYNKVLDKVTKKFPRKSLRLHFETRPSDPAFMYIFAEPVTQKQIKEIQGRNREQFLEFEKNVLGLVKAVDEAAANPPNIGSDPFELDEEGEPYNGGQETNVAETWEEMMAKVEQVLRDEEQGSATIQESIESALLQSGIIDNGDSKESRRFIHALASALTTDGEIAETTGWSAQSQASSLPADDAAVSSDGAALVNPETQESDAETVAKEQASLKDLVLQLASQVKLNDQGQVLSTPEQHNVQDTARLQKFMSILSELVATNRAAPEKPVVEDDSVDEPVDPEELEEPQEVTAGVESKMPAKLLGMILTVKNKVNDKYVDRPFGLHPKAKWEVEYVIEEMKEEQARTLYLQTRKRRESAFNKMNSPAARKALGFRLLGRRLQHYARRGRKFRSQETEQCSQEPVHVYGVDGPLTWESVFGDEKSNAQIGVYEKWKSESEPDKEWEDTKEREQWARAMRNRRRHTLQFENSSSWCENDPRLRNVQVEEMRKKKVALEKKIATMELLIGRDADQDSMPLGRSKVESWFQKTLSSSLARGLNEAKTAERDLNEAKTAEVASGEMFGLNLNDLDDLDEGAEQEGEEESDASVSKPEQEEQKKKD